MSRLRRASIPTGAGAAKTCTQVGTLLRWVAVLALTCMSCESRRTDGNRPTAVRPHGDGIIARILVQNDANSQLPFLAPAIWPPDGRVPGTTTLVAASKDGKWYEFICSAKTAVVNVEPTPVWPDGHPEGVSHEYTSFFPPGTLLRSSIGEGPTIIGLFRLKANERRDIQIDAGEPFSVRWMGSPVAAVYSVTVHHAQSGGGGVREVAILGCTRKGRVLSVRRMALINAIVSRSRLAGDPRPFDSAQMSPDGALIRVRFRLVLTVRGFNEAGQEVYRAREDTEYVVDDKAGLRVLSMLTTVHEEKELRRQVP